MRCVAFCSAENYQLTPIANFLRKNGFVIKQHRKTLHVYHATKEYEVFIFSYGCLVTWGLKHQEELQLLEQLKQFSTNPLPTTEKDSFIYSYGTRVEMATHERFNTDIIVLDSDNTRLKLALSYSLAQSVQLESYESSVQKTIEEYSHYPEQLARKGRISLSQKEISKRMGKIFLARSSINLNSEYLASPEYFWEHPSFEDVYLMCKKFLDIPRRVTALNQKLEVLHELFEILTSQRQHLHSDILEAIIILLFLVDIVITLVSKLS